MNLFFGEVARKLADHWARLIVLPGLLYIGVLVVVAPLTPWHGDVAGTEVFNALLVPGYLRQTAGTVAGAGAAFLAAAAVAGLLASLLLGQSAAALAGLVERFWLGDWPAWAAQWRTDSRRNAWEERDNEIVGQTELGLSAVDARHLAQLLAKRDEIGQTRPQRPTWMGDRIASVEALLDQTYHLPLRACWPRLWLILPDRAREDLQVGAQSFQDQTMVAGWGLMYLAMAVYWWPAALAVPLVLAVAWRRGRDRLDRFAELVESSMDLYAADLCRALGLTVEGRLTPAAGDSIRVIVEKSR